MSVVKKITIPKETVSEIVFKEWFVDSGASDHVCNDLRLFKTLRPIQCEIRVAKQSERLMAVGEGTIESEELTLNNVLYVPDIVRNVLSVSTLTKNAEIHFTHDNVFISATNKNGVVEGKRHTNRLYFITLKHKTTEMISNNNYWSLSSGRLGFNELKPFEDGKKKKQPEELNEKKE